MNFHAAKCPQCGGALQVPDNLDSVKCMYCGTDILIREAINLASGGAGNWPNLAQVAEDAGNHSEAYGYFTKILELEPKNAEAWAGKARNAGWQSNLNQSRLEEMLVCYEKAVDAASNDGMKEVVKLNASLSIMLIATAFFNLSTEHTIQFVSVPSAKFEHIQRCKEIIRACERARAYNPDLNEAKNLIVDICNRLAQLSGIADADKRFFESVRNRYAPKATSPQVGNAAQTSSDCFVVTATMGDERSAFVLILRDFRDQVLKNYLVGRTFIAWYYRNGPAYAKIIRNSTFKRALSFLLIVLPCAALAHISLHLSSKRRSAR